MHPFSGLICGVKTNMSRQIFFTWPIIGPAILIDIHPAQFRASTVKDAVFFSRILRVLLVCPFVLQQIVNVISKQRHQRLSVVCYRVISRISKCCQSAQTRLRLAHLIPIRIVRCRHTVSGLRLPQVYLLVACFFATYFNKVPRVFWWECLTTINPSIAASLNNNLSVSCKRHTVW